MLKNQRIRTKQTITILSLTLGSLLIVYLGVFQISRRLKSISGDLFEEIASNGEKTASQVLYEEAEDMIKSTVEAQADTTDSRVSILVYALQGISLRLGRIYKNGGDDFDSRNSYSPKREEVSIDGKYIAQYMLCQGTKMTEDIQKELDLIAKLNPRLLSFMEYFPNADSIYVATESGLFYNSSDHQDYDPKYVAKNRPWYIHAMRNPGKINWEGTYTDPFGGEFITASITYANPGNDKILGVISVDISLEKVMKSILGGDRDIAGTSFLLGDDFQVIAVEGMEDYDNFDARMEGHFDEADLVRENLLKKPDKAFSTFMHGEEVYMWGRQSSVTHWYFCTAIPSEMILEPIRLVDEENTRILQDVSAQSQSYFQRIWISMLITFLFVATAVSIAAFLLSHSLTAPLDRLKTKAMEIGEGHFDIEIVPESRDEIGDLATKINEMQGSLKDYMEHLKHVTAEKERISAELSLAASIQSSQLPRDFPAFPDVLEVDVFASMNPAKEVGGDFYDFFMVDESHAAIVVADVSGKGVPAALFMMIGKTLIKEHTGPGADLGKVFTDVNRILCGNNAEQLFITAYEAVLDLESGEVRFVNAGHEHPFLIGTDEEGRKTVTEMTPRAGLVLAAMDGVRYHEGSFMMKPGDKLFQYTDGVTEATSEENELYGMSRLDAFLRSHSDMAIQDLLPALKEDLDKFAGNAPQFDDITMLCLEYKDRMIPADEESSGE